MKVRVADKAIIDEEELLRTALQRTVGGTNEASDGTEITFVAYRDECLTQLLSADGYDTLLERRRRKEFVILPSATEREGDGGVC